MQPDVRQKSYKQTIDKDDARRNREETTISLRKDKRAEQLHKKRFGGAGPSNAAAYFNTAATAAEPNATQGAAVSTGAQAWHNSQPALLGTMRPSAPTPYASTLH